MKIPDGFKLLVVDASGTIIETIEIGETDTSKPFGRAEIIDEIERAVRLTKPVSED